MIKESFYGELLIEDYSQHLGLPERKMLYVLIWENTDGKLLVELHDNHPNGMNTFIGQYGDFWLLKKVKWSLFATVYELTLLQETPPVKARCVTGHKFGKMLKNAISKLAEQK
jgi:hypothetical protein